MKFNASTHALRQNWFVLTLLVFSSILIAFLVAKVNLLVSPVIVVLVMGVTGAYLVYIDYRIGFYGGLILTAVMFYFERLIPVSLPYGLVGELCFLLAFLVMVFNPKHTHWKQYLTHPITIGYLLTFIYQIFQVFNPNAVSLVGWAVSLRGLLLMIIMIVSLELMSKLENIKILIKVWLALALAAALYAIYQEFIGLPGFEMRWVTTDPLRYRQYYILGHMRKFSFLSDPGAFGVFMSASALGAFALIFSPVSISKKIGLAVSSIIMVIAMFYSGTRTAYAMLAIGIVFFILITIQKKSTFITAALLVLTFLTIMYGPFYNRYVNRFRTAFSPSKDASMEVRDTKRVDWQPLIQTHPMGYGINTSGASGLRFAPGHWLAGWDTDSGYLKVAMELGWVGLVILFVFLLMVALYGIGNHFALRDPMLQSINLSFLISFFAVSVAAYTQHALLYKPVHILVISTYSVVICLRKLEKPNSYENP